VAVGIPRLLIAALRRGLAAAVLFFAGLAAFDAAAFKVWHPALCRIMVAKPRNPRSCSASRPNSTAASPTATALR
jgi:hypothetical protein